MIKDQNNTNSILHVNVNFVHCISKYTIRLIINKMKTQKFRYENNNTEVTQNLFLYDLKIKTTYRTFKTRLLIKSS